MNAASSTPNQIITEEGSEEKKETFKEGCNAPQKLEDSEMRGVHAKTNIPSNTICVSIPLKCLITVEMGQATEIGQIILRSDLDLDAPKHIFLMIFLLWDRKVNNQKKFLRSLLQCSSGDPTQHSHFLVTGRTRMVTGELSPQSNFRSE